VAFCSIVAIDAAADALVEGLAPADVLVAGVAAAACVAAL